MGSDAGQPHSVITSKKNSRSSSITNDSNLSSEHAQEVELHQGRVSPDGIYRESSIGMNPSQLQSPNFSTATENVHFESFEIDDATMMSSGGASWVNRINWLRGRRNRTPTADDGLGTGLSFGEHNANAVYHGSVLEVDGGIFKAGNTTLRNNKKLQGSSVKVVPSLSQLTTTQQQRSDEDSLDDFDEAEWTPHDSSYGAAFPLCGCIPKRIRRLIEATMIGITVFMLVYLVVTTSIKISSVHDRSTSHNSGKNSDSDMYSGGEIFLDDDRYIESKPKQYDDYVKPEYSKTDDDVDDGFHDDRVSNDDHSRF